MAKTAISFFKEGMTLALNIYALYLRQVPQIYNQDGIKICVTHNTSKISTIN